MKLVEIFDSQCPGKGLEIVSYLKNRDCPFPYTKIVNNTTRLVENSMIDFPLGVNIDIFPYDGLPADSAESRKLLARITYLHGKLVLKSLTYHRGRRWYKNAFLFLARMASLFQTIDAL